ncbi:MAG: sugar kinase [Lachnospiraceae bacterium]|nr:sugar kinase [Lachnospiraceae bacterium]
MKHNKFDLLSLGEILLRLSPPGNERLSRSDVFDKHIGGAELNVVSGVSMLGLKTGMISKLPDNLLGSYAGNQVHFYGVGDDYLSLDREKNARLGIYYYESGAHPRKPQVVYDRMHSSIQSISIKDFPEEMYHSTRCFHTTGITLALGGQCRETAIEMIKRFKEAGALISFDVNFRGNLWTGAEAKECIESILPYTDIFFCSADTARLTFQKEGSTREMMQSFAKDYPISVIASTKRTVHSPKKHSFTSVIYDVGSKTFYEEEPYENIEVVDRIGSGDAYIAGALYGYLAYGDCRKALEYGNAASAMKNTIPGDMPCSDLKELTKTIEEHRQTGELPEMSR